MKYNLKTLTLIYNAKVFRVKVLYLLSLINRIFRSHNKQKFHLKSGNLSWKFCQRQKQFRSKLWSVKFFSQNHHILCNTTYYVFDVLWHTNAFHSPKRKINIAEKFFSLTLWTVKTKTPSPFIAINTLTRFSSLLGLKSKAILCSRTHNKTKEIHI